MTYTDPYRVQFANDLWLVMDVGEVKQSKNIDSYAPVEYTAAEAANAAPAVEPLNTACATSSIFGDDTVSVYTSQFAQLTSLVSGTTQSRLWVGAHRPFYGLVNVQPADEATLTSFDCELATSIYLSNISISGVLGVVSGHFHAFEIVEFDGPTGFPTTIVIGNSGTQLATPRQGQPFGIERVNGKRTVLGELVSNAQTIGEFGFGIINVPSDDTAIATNTAKFLSDEAFQGHTDVMTELLPKALHASESFATP